MTTWSNLSKWLHRWARKASFNSLENNKPLSIWLLSFICLCIYLISKHACVCALFVCAYSKLIRCIPRTPKYEEYETNNQATSGLQQPGQCRQWQWRISAPPALFPGFQLPTSSQHLRAGEEVAKRAEHSPCSSRLLPGLSGKARGQHCPPPDSL